MPSVKRHRAHRAALAAAAHGDVDRVAVDADQRGEATVRAERRVDALLEQLADLLGDVAGELERAGTGQRIGTVGIADDEPALAGVGRHVERRTAQGVDRCRRGS